MSRDQAETSRLATWDENHIRPYCLRIIKPDYFVKTANF